MFSFFGHFQFVDGFILFREILYGQHTHRYAHTFVVVIQLDLNNNNNNKG